MRPIKNVFIAGGTHGNEFTGIYLLKKWQEQKTFTHSKDVQVHTILSNPRAFSEGRRYFEKDLNRCFQKKALDFGENHLYEEKRAREIKNEILGKTEDPQSNFLIDLHTTTSNMGPTLILMNDDLLSLQIAAILKNEDPSLNLCKIAQSETESPFLNALLPKGFLIEVGPIPQGVLRPSIFFQTEKIVLRTLELLKNYNTGTFTKEMSKVLQEKTIPLFYVLKTIDYPRNEMGELDGMIHPDREGKDFQKMEKGDPLFLLFSGETIFYQEEEPVWPIFINEAAYYEKGEALTFTTKKEMVVPLS